MNAVSVCALWFTFILTGYITGVGQATADGLPRAMSTDLCSDLLLLSLAAPEQIVSVSAASLDPRISAMAEQARRYPTNRGTVEDVLYSHPDILLAYTGWSVRRHSELLARVGTEIAPVPYARDWPQIIAATRHFARLLKREAAGEAIVARVERGLERLRDRNRGYRVLYLRPNGGSAAAETYVDQVFALLGLRNLASERGLAGWGRYPLELLVAEPPDILVLGYFDERAPLTKETYARHPLLGALIERTPTISVPNRNWGCGGWQLIVNWGCGGWQLIVAAGEIADAIDRLDLGEPPSIGDNTPSTGALGR